MNIKNKNKGDIDCQYVGAVSVASAHETTVSVADDAAATTVEPRSQEANFLSGHV